MRSPMTGTHTGTKSRQARMKPESISLRPSCLQLDILAGRLVTSGSVTVKGQVLVNGEPWNRARFERSVSYVLQDDHLPHTETVREVLHFNACMRLPSSVSKAQREERVNSILEELVRCSLERSFSSLQSSGASWGFLAVPLDFTSVHI